MAAVTRPHTIPEFVQLQRDFAGYDPAKRKASIPALAQCLLEDIQLVDMYLSSRQSDAIQYDDKLTRTILPYHFLPSESQEQRIFLRLRMLFLHHGLYGWDVGTCMGYRWQRDGFSPLLLLESLECFSYFPVTYNALHRYLQPHMDECAELILSWIPALPHHLLTHAFRILDDVPTQQQRALVMFLDMVQPNDGRQIDHATELVRRWLSDSQHPQLFDPDELFACLRTLLGKPRNQRMWQLLCTLLDCWDIHHDASLAAEYADIHTPEQEKEKRQLDPSALKSLDTDAPYPSARLARKLRPCLYLQVNPPFDALRTILGHPYVQHYTHLDLSRMGNVTPIFTIMRQEGWLPSLHSLDIIKSGLAWEHIADIWRYDMFPQLTHLNISRNQLTLQSDSTTPSPGNYFTRLTYLDLSHNQLSDNDLELIASWPALTKLQHLDLREHIFSDKMISHLLTKQTFAKGCTIQIYDEDGRPLSEELRELAESQGYRLLPNY